MWYRLTEKHTLSMLGVNSSPLPACVFFLRRHSSMHYLTPTKMRKFMRGNLAWHSNMEPYIGWHTPVPGFGSALCELLNFGVSTEKVWEPRCFNSFPHTQHDHPAAWAQIHIQNMTTLSTSEVLLPKSNRPTRVFEHLRTFDSKTQSFSQRVLLNDLLRLCGSTSVFCNRCERARYVKRCVLFRPKNLTICLFNSALCPIRWWHQTLDFLGTQRRTRQATFKPFRTSFRAVTQRL